MPRIPLSWLAEHVALPDGATAEAVAADLVRVGLEEEAIHPAAVTGPLVLAAGLRSAYAIGWGLAALVAVGMVLLLPGDLVVVALVAISVGPVAGAAVHLVAFARR